MIDFHEIMFYQSKSSMSQLRKFQYLHFKNLNKLKPFWIQMVYNIVVSRRFHMLGKFSKIDWLLNQLISLHKLTQLLTNQPKIGFLFDIYALNLFQLDNVIIQWLICLLWTIIKHREGNLLIFNNFTIHSTLCKIIQNFKIMPK